MRRIKYVAMRGEDEVDGRLLVGVRIKCGRDIFRMILK
jgi:hypothetical protein